MTHITSCISGRCPGCRRSLGCRCGATEAAHEAFLDASYQAGYDLALLDYDERAGTEWLLRSGVRWLAVDGRTVPVAVPLYFRLFSWRSYHRSVECYAAWYRREYGCDLVEYLRGFDDAGAGLPSAVDAPEAHARAAAALDAYRPVPAPTPDPVTVWPDSDDDGLPF